MRKTEPPSVEAHLFLYPGGTVRGWKIVCPFCGKKHVHGAGQVGASKEVCLSYLGHRVSHCSGDNPGYVLAKTNAFEAEWVKCLEKEGRKR